MVKGKLHNLTLRLTAYYMSISLGLILPLSPLTIYAQTTGEEPATNNAAEEVEEPEGAQPIATVTDTTFDAPPAEDPAIGTYDNAEEKNSLTAHHFVSGSFVRQENDSRGELGPLSITIGSDGTAESNGVYYLLNPKEIERLNNPEAVNNANTEPAETEPAETEPAETEPAETEPDEERIPSTPFEKVTQGSYQKLLVGETFGSRLSISKDDLTALTGENNGDCLAWSEDNDEVFDNGFCDPPRADWRLIAALDYLLRPRSEGGAGREYLRVSRVVQYEPTNLEQESDDTETIKEPVLRDLNGNNQYEPELGEGFIDTNGNGQWDAEATTQSIGEQFADISMSPHYIDLHNKNLIYETAANGKKYAVAFNRDQTTVSQAVDISEIDRLRVTTKITRKGLFGSSNKYKYQKPINIKVAWQSDDGIAAHALPEISVHEIIKDLSVSSLLELLDAEGALGEFDFEGRSLETLSTEDIAKFVGGQLLSSLLGGENIANFNFNDTLRDFGAIVLGGALNIDPEAIRNANSIADIEEYTGRTDVAKTVGLEGTIVGDTQDEVLQSIGRQRFADLMGVKAYTLVNYNSVDEFKSALGWGRIEDRLPVPEKSFSSNNKDEVRNAVGANRFGLIFATENASIIAERLQIPTDRALDFINGGSVQDFKRVVGEQVWRTNIESYKITSYVPTHPSCVALTVAGEPSDAANVAQGYLQQARTSLEGVNMESFAANRNAMSDLVNQVRSSANFPNTTRHGVDSLVNQCSYTDAAGNRTAREGFLQRYDGDQEAGGSLKSVLAQIITDLENTKPVVKNNSVQIQNARQDERVSKIYSSLESLYAARDALEVYKLHDTNPDGTGTQRDKAFNLPAGVTYDIIGGAKENEAFKKAGIWYLSQRLPNSQRNSFLIAAESDSEEGRRRFVPADTKQEVYRDVFLSDGPKHEFRRIGRRLLLARLQDSPTADSLKQTDFVTDILFYYNRFQAIHTGLNTIKNNLESLPDNVKAEFENKINSIDSLIDGAAQSFRDREAAANSLNAQGLMRDYKNQLYGLIDSINQTDSLKNINAILQAVRDIERATMEILEGQNVSYNSSIPNSVSVPDIDNPNVSGKSGLESILGSDKLFVRAAFQGISGQMSVQEILVQLGIGKLSNLLELPTDALFEYHKGSDKGTDGFLAAVGRGRRIQQQRRPANDRETEIREGRDYLIRYTIPSLARRLNIEMPDWIRPEDIAELVLGNPIKALVAIGGNRVEEALDLPANFVSDVVYPEGATDQERNENRQHTIINATLQKLGVELELPDGFVLDSNPVVSMGAARVENVLNWNRGDFKGTRQQILERVGKARLLTALGDSLPRAANTAYQNANRLRPTVVKYMQENGVCNIFPNFITEVEAPESGCDENIVNEQMSPEMYELRDNLEEYDRILQEEVNRLFAGTPLYGSDSADEADRRDADRRTEIIDLRLKQIDNRLGLQNADATGNIGTTQKWLEGQISTDEFTIAAGRTGAALFGADALAAALERIGVDGKVFDELIGNGANRDFLVNFFTRGSYTKEEFAQLYTILSGAFSINLDKALGFEAGTFSRLITEKDTDDILFDQGMRLFARKALHIDLSYDTNRYDSTINARRVIQRAIFGAFRNEDGLFVYDTANAYRGIIEAGREVGNMAQQYIQGQLGGDISPYLKAPIGAIFAVLDMNLQALDGMDRTLAISDSMRRAIQDDDSLTTSILSEIAREANRLQALSGQDIGGASPETVSTISNAVNSQYSSGVDLSDTLWDVDTGTEGVAAESDSMNTPAIAPNSAPSSSPIGNVDINYDTPLEEPANEMESYLAQQAANNPANKPAATTALNEAGKRELTLQSIQMVNKATWSVIGKHFGFALADFALSTVVGHDIAAPGLTARLVDGTPEQRTEAIAFVASQLLIDEFGTELNGMGLGWLVDQPTVEGFINLMQGHGQDFGTILANQGAAALGRFEDRLQQDKFFKYLGLKDGTLVGLFGFVIQGNTGDFAPFGEGGPKFEGLGKIYNTEWLLGRAFYFAEQLTGIPAGKFAQLYFLSKNFYKSYTAFMVESTKQVKDVAKIAKLKTEWVNAAIQLGIFVLDMLFGKEIAKFETSLGLPPGTILQAFGLILTALLVGTGPMFFVTLGIFVIMTIFGFGFTRITTRATADGYYPFVGKKGEFAPPFDKRTGNVPYTQWPSADVLDNFGKPTKPGSGEFDPTDEAQKITGFKDAARGKVIGLVDDLYQADGRFNNLEPAKYNSNIRPSKIYVHLIKEQVKSENSTSNGFTGQSNVYLQDKRYAEVIGRVNNQFYPGACQGTQTNTGASVDPANWGVCTNGNYRDVVHIAW